jgi:hypothetical protein
MYAVKCLFINSKGEQLVEQKAMQLSASQNLSAQSEHQQVTKNQKWQMN